jgi:hypothetical protein
MKSRIAMWAIAGFLIAGCWALYFASVSKDNPIEPIVYTLSRLSCPIVLVGDYFHFRISLYSVLLTNLAIYGLLGLSVEMLRRRVSHAAIVRG